MAFARAFLTALIGSLAANLVLMFLLRAVVINPAMPLNALSVVPITTFTIMGVVGGIIVYGLLPRFLANPNRAFICVAIVVLIASFIPDYLIIGQTTGPFAGGSVGTALLLMLMHVVTAMIVVGSMIRLWGKRSVER